MPAAPAFKRLPRAVREQQMLDAAVKVFSRHGFHGANMDEIAELAGISKPMLYAYLGSKEVLFVACLRREATRMMEAIAAAAAPDLPTEEQLWRGLRAFFGFVGTYRDGWVVLYRQARGEPPFAGELATMRFRVIEVVAGMLGQAIRAGRHEVPDAELEIMAYTLVGAAESLADWLADHAEADPDRAATRLMNVAWLGADRLLAGETWRPAVEE